MWRERPSLTPDEARQLHHDALVIDTKFPGMLSVPSARVRAVFDEERKKPGVFRQQNRGLYEFKTPVAVPLARPPSTVLILGAEPFGFNSLLKPR